MTQIEQIQDKLYSLAGMEVRKKYQLIDRIEKELLLPRPTIRRVISHERARITQLSENKRTSAERRLIHIIKEKSQTPTANDKIRRIKQVLKSGDTTHIMIQAIGEIVNA